jgi:hypothetical protein
MVNFENAPKISREEEDEYGEENIIESSNAKKTGEVVSLENFRRNREGKEGEISKKIGMEQQESRERFGDLIEMVSKKYENLPENMKKDFIEHNQEILDSAIELGTKNEFSKGDLQKLELASILHDMTKADSVPEEYKNIPNYTLAMHAKKAAELVPDILTDEYLEKHGIMGDSEEVRRDVAKAILEHMGPRPGFMEGILTKFNKDMEAKGGKGIDYPAAEGKVSEALLAADMKSLAGEKGRKKILSIRNNVSSFSDQDKKMVEEYKLRGIDLSQGEAALLSGFDSAFQARDMLGNEKNREWVNQTIKKSKKGEYSYGEEGKKLDWQTAEDKRKQFEEKKSLEAVREKFSAR